MKVTKIAPALFALLLPFAADAKLGATGSSSVSFAANGPAGMRIVGTSSDLSVSDDAQNVTVTVPLGNLKTGIDLRDRHMREKYLEVGKYPNAELVVDRSAIKFPADGAESSGNVNGTMTIHGQSKPVVVAYKAKRSGSAYDVSGSLRVNIKEYGVEVPSYLGVTVKPDVDVALSARVQD